MTDGKVALRTFVMRVLFETRLNMFKGSIKTFHYTVEISETHAKMFYGKNPVRAKQLRSASATQEARRGSYANWRTSSALR